MRGFRDLSGAEVVHAYGATETTPVVTMNRYKPSVRKRLTDDELVELKRKHGFRSGDLGTIDSDGYLKVTGRLKDVIKSGDEWISSIDMENLLLSHPAIAEAAVVGLRHPQWQERPFVLVGPKPGVEITLEEIREHLSLAFAKWQLPEALEIVSQIPKTSVGKFDKKVIRASYDDGDRGAPAGE